MVKWVAKDTTMEMEPVTTPMLLPRAPAPAPAAEVVAGDAEALA
jgi:hypothetical protein